MQPSARSFFELSRHFKTTILVSVDFVLLNTAFLAGVLLRYNTLPDTLLAHPWLPPVAALIGVVSCALFGVYRSVIRHIATRALFNLLIALSIASLFIVVVVYMTRTTELARSVPILWLLTGFIFTAGFRYAIRSIFLRWGIESREKNEIIIYGAGSTGVSMASALIQAGHYAIKAFIDADPNLQGRMIQGIRVFSPEKLPQLLKKRPDYTLLLALPSLDKAARKQLLDELSQYPLRIKNLPPMQRLVSGLSIRDLPNVDIESLLERPTVTPDPALMRQAIADKVVLVTGAGGSIGSEIVNQVLNHQPKKLIVLDHSEFAIYQLLKAHPNANITPIIGSVMNTQLLDKVFKQQAIQTVYHAAA
ncbi:MAG: polysaccharide biosynthesis protein, partial [Pseudomonadota bacterium]|nr:polysaccharide biosynthesis protein [Pseudomonadota bacterium]